MEKYLEEIEKLIESGKKLDGKRLIERELEKNPDSIEFLYALGDLSLELKYLNDSEGAFSRLKDIDPRDKRAYIGLAKVNYEKAFYDKVILMVDRALEIDPESYESLILKYKSYKKMGKPARDKKACIESILDLKTTPEYLLKLVEIHIEEEEYERAIEILKPMIARYSNHQSMTDIRRLYGIAKKKTKIKSSGTDRGDRTEKPILDELNSFIGLEEVKHEVDKLIKQIQFHQERKIKFGLDGAGSEGYHFVFTGNPGTGKTTIARILGRVLKEYGLLEGGELIEVERPDLVGEHIGSTGPKTREKIEEAMGGILFIDEAYSLSQKSSSRNDFGKEAIDTIVKAMEDNRGKFTIIMAGYEKEMDELLESNPGLRSRFNKFINFPDYSEDELLLIADKIAGERNFKITDSGKAGMKLRLAELKIDENFGNAREVRNLIGEAIENRSYELELSGTEYTREEVTTLYGSNFGIEDPDFQQDRIEETIEKINKLVGLKNVKEELYNIKQYVNYQKKRKSLGFKSEDLSLHMIFQGNPGTGKTMIARYVGEMFKNLGILKKGHFIEVKRPDLVGQHIGETAIKTEEVIKSAYGGVLFIDEAYSLVQGSKNDFGNEAISVLIKEMEDNRDKLVVIFAGYKDEMKELIDSNPGIDSRVKSVLEFEDYNPEELLDIFKLFCENEQYEISPGAEQLLKELFNEIYDNKSERFGNARDVRNIFEEVKIKLAIRSNKSEVNIENINLIIESDVEN